MKFIFDTDIKLVVKHLNLMVIIGVVSLSVKLLSGSIKMGYNYAIDEPLRSILKL